MCDINIICLVKQELKIVKKEAETKKDGVK